MSLRDMSSPRAKGDVEAKIEVLCVLPAAGVASSFLDPAATRAGLREPAA